MKKSPKPKKAMNMRTNNRKKSRNTPDPRSKKDSQRMTVVENVVDEGQNKKSTKLHCSRCSSTCFKDAMAELKPILGHQQRIRINETPFANWIDMLELAVSSRRVDFILNRFQIDTCSLTVGDDITIPFTPEEFSIILGLHHIGQPIDLDLKMDSIFVARRFGGQVGKAKRATIHKKLISLAGSDDELEIDDFVRLYILFIFNSIIFSTENYFTPSFIFPHLDNLTTFFEYAWGDAAFRFIQREIRKTGTKTYFDGCTVGLMAWVYERVPSLGVRRSLEMFPRLFRWGDSKIPLCEENAELLFRSIDSTKVLPIYPFSEEKKLDVLKLADGTTNSVRVEEVVRKKVVEIKNRMCLEIGCGSVRRRRKKKIVIEKEFMDVGAELKLPTENEREFVMEEEYHIERNDGHENTERNKEDENVKRYKNIERNVEEYKTENDEGNVHIARFEDKENSENIKEREMIEDVGNASEIGSCNDCDNDSELNLVVQNVVNEISKDVVGFEKNYGTCEERKSVSCVGTDNATNFTSFQSSIVDTVRTRVDRKKKMKVSMFVTPPSSSPSPKKKGQKRCIRLKEKCIIDVDENAKSPTEDLHEFKGRNDYSGHEKATDEEKQVLTQYLSMEELNVVIWEDESMLLDGRKFCNFVFGKPVDFEIINVYMRIMQSKSKEYGSEIYCVDTTVQREILNRLKEYGSRRKLHSDDYGDFLASLTSATRERLKQLNEELFTRCKYIIFPLNDRWHWFLLVYKTSDGVFSIWNSLHDPYASGTTNVFVSFLSGYMHFQSAFVLPNKEVVTEECRDQGPTLECGVYALMWTECLAKDTEEIWAYQRDVNMNAYRARVGATILSDKNGLLKTI